MLLPMLLVFGVIYGVKRYKLLRMEHDRYPDAPADEFRRWQRMELRSIDALLITVGGGIVIGYIWIWPLFFVGSDPIMPFVLYLLLLLLGFTISAVIGSKAKRLREALQSKIVRETTIRL